MLHYVEQCFLLGAKILVGFKFKLEMQELDPTEKYYNHTRLQFKIFLTRTNTYLDSVVRAQLHQVLGVFSSRLSRTLIVHNC
jgi:hypothetical protein